MEYVERNDVHIRNCYSLGEPPEGGVGLMVEIATDRTTFRAVELDKYSGTSVALFILGTSMTFDSPGRDQPIVPGSERAILSSVWMDAQ